MSSIWLDFAVIQGHIPVLKVERRGQSHLPPSPQRCCYLTSSARWQTVTKPSFARGTQCCRRCPVPVDRITLYNIATSSWHRCYRGALIASWFISPRRLFDYWTIHWSWNCPTAPHGPAPPCHPTSWASLCSFCLTRGAPYRISCSGGPHSLPYDSSRLNRRCASTSSSTPDPRTAFFSPMLECSCHVMRFYLQYYSSTCSASSSAESYVNHWQQRIAACALRRSYYCSCYCRFHYCHGPSHFLGCS